MKTLMEIYATLGYTVAYIFLVAAIVLALALLVIIISTIYNNFRNSMGKDSECSECKYFVYCEPHKTYFYKITSEYCEDFESINGKEDKT